MVTAKAPPEGSTGDDAVAERISRSFQNKTKSLSVYSADGGTLSGEAFTRPPELSQRSLRFTQKDTQLIEHEEIKIEMTEESTDPSCRLIKVKLSHRKTNIISICILTDIKKKKGNKSRGLKEMPSIKRGNRASSYTNAVPSAGSRGATWRCM